MNPASHIWTDATLLRDRVHADQPADLELMRQAVDLYHGDFLDRLTLVNTLDFEAWMLIMRDRLRDQVITMLDHLISYALDHGNSHNALVWARRLVELDPIREASQRALMWTLACSGHRASALAQYDVCVHLLAAELCVEPEPTTVELAARIRDHQPTSDLHIPSPPASFLPPTTATPSVARLHAERRQITILSCMLIVAVRHNTTLHAVPLVDPEPWYEVLSAYQQCSARVITECCGYPALVHGRHILALFGYPLAHEDDAIHAITTGLALISTVARTQITCTPPMNNAMWAVQIGIHTGDVLIPPGADLAERAAGIAGLPLDVAGRLAECAAPQSLRISSTSYQFVRRHVVCQPIGTQNLVEMTGPLPIYQVMQLRAVGNSIENVWHLTG